jgi:hypothetical protein
LFKNFHALRASTSVNIQFGNIQFLIEFHEVKTHPIFAPLANERFYYHLKRLLYILFISTLGTLSSAPAMFGQSNAVYEFLTLPGSARLAAIGSHQPAILKADLTTISANPALLDSLAHEQLNASYMNYLAGIHMGIIGGAFSISDVGTFAAHLRYLNYGRISRTDVEGNTLGDFSPQDLALRLSGSRELFPQLQGGIQLNFIYQNYDRYSSIGLSVDAGLIYRFTSQKTVLGITFQNMGSQLTTFNGIREPLPFNIALGFAQQLKYLPMRLHVGFNQLQDWSMNTETNTDIPLGDFLIRKLMIGSEWDLGEHVQARLGYQPSTNSMLNLDRRIDPAGLRAGIGIALRAFQFDVGYHSYSSLGAITMLTVQTNLSTLR